MSMDGSGGISKYYFIKCEQCGIEMIDKPKTHRTYNHINIWDLKSVYECLIHDIGHDVYSETMNSIRLHRPAKDFS